jgi:hypothetical protein
VFDVPDLNNDIPVTITRNGDYWLVKSRTIWIQGRYEANEWSNGKACMHGLAVGGTFMGTNRIIVGPRDGKVYFNSREILVNINTDFAEGNIRATSRDSGQRLDDGMEEPLHIVKLHLPSGVTILVNRWGKHIDALITMTKQAQQDGHCGNFNGIAEDDTKEQILLRLPGQVSPRHDMFPPTTFNKVPRKPFTLQDCEPGLLAKAKRRCHRMNTGAPAGIVSACVMDVCLEGFQFAAEDSATELRDGRRRLLETSGTNSTPVVH